MKPTTRKILVNLGKLLLLLLVVLVIGYLAHTYNVAMEQLQSNESQEYQP